MAKTLREVSWILIILYRLPIEDDLYALVNGRLFDSLLGVILLEGGDFSIVAKRFILKDCKRVSE